MSKKYLASGLTSLSLVGLASAQITGGAGGYQGILPLISQILGIDVGNPYNLLGVLATFGIMSIANYIILKKAFMKMDMLDVVNLGGGHGSSGGRNILAILSVLMTLSIVGTGAFMGIINGFRSIILLMFSFMIFGLLILVIGGSGTLGFGGLSYASGKGAKAAAEGLKQGAEGYKKAQEAYGEAKELTAAGEEDAEEGNLQDAEQEFENTVRLMEEVAPNLGEDFEGMESELEDAYREYMDALNDESDEEQRIGDIEKRIKRVRLYLETAVRGGSSLPQMVIDKGSGDVINDGPYSQSEVEDFIQGNLPSAPFDAEISADVDYPSNYGLAKIEEDIQKIQEDIKIAEKDYQDESGDLAQALKEFEDVIERAIRAQSLIRKMINLLKELEKDSEEMEAIEEKRQLEQLHNASESMISEERKVEDIISQLEDYESDIENKVETVLNAESKFLEFDDEEIEQLKQELKWESDLEPVVTELRQAFANSKGGATSIDDGVLDNGVSVMSDVIGKLSTLHDEMENMINQFEDEEREVYGRMESILGEAAENEDQNEIAHEIGDDLRTWLGEGNTRYT